MKKTKLSTMSIAAISVGTAAVVTTAVVTPILLTKDNKDKPDPISPKRETMNVEKWLKSNEGYLSTLVLNYDNPFSLSMDNNQAKGLIEEEVLKYVDVQMNKEGLPFNKENVSVAVTSYVPPKLHETKGSATYTISYGNDRRYNESYNVEIDFAKTFSLMVEDFFVTNDTTELHENVTPEISILDVNELKTAIDAGNQEAVSRVLNSILQSDTQYKEIWSKISLPNDDYFIENVEFVNLDDEATNYTVKFDVNLKGFQKPFRHTLTMHTSDTLKNFTEMHKHEAFQQWYEANSSHLVMTPEYLADASRPVPTIADVDTSVLDADHVFKPNSFNYVAPTGDSNTGVVTFDIESADHTESVQHTINVPYQTTPNEDVINAFHNIDVTTPISSINADTIKGLSLLPAAQRPAALLTILGDADSQDFSPVSVSNVIVDSIDDSTTKDFHVAFDITLGNATKNLTFDIVTTNTVAEIQSTQAHAELATWYAQHSSEIVANPSLDLTNPRTLSLSDVVQTAFDTDYSIKAGTFAYSGPTGDETTGDISFEIEHDSATQIHTISVDFDNSPNEVLINTFADLTLSSVIANYDADDVVAFGGLSQTQMAAEITTLLKANFSSQNWDDVTISNCSVDQYTDATKTFTYNFTVSKGSATKDISFTFTTEHSSAELAAQIELAELNTFVGSLPENVLQSSVDLAEPHEIIVGNVDTQLFTTGFTIKPGSFAYTAPINADSNSAQISFVVVHGGSEVTVTKNVEFDQTANEAIANRKVFDIGSAEHPTSLIKLPEIQSIHDDFDATKTDAQRVAILRSLLAKGGITDFDGKTIQNVLTPDDFDGDAEPHVITFDCVENGVTKTYTLNIFVQVSVLDYWEGMTNEQPGQITHLTPDQEEHVKSHISTKDITQEAADAAWQIRELMANDPNAAWHPIGDSVIDGFNAIRYVIYKDAWGDYQPKQLLDQFLRSAFPELRFAGDGEKEKVLIHMLIAAGHSEFVNASFRNIMLAKEYLPTETSATVTFDAKLPGESDYTSYTFNINNFAAQVDAANPQIQSSVGSAGIAQLGAGEHSAQDWINNMGGHFYAGNVKFQTTSHFNSNSLDNPFAPFNPALDTDWGPYMGRTSDGARTVDDAQTYLIRPTGDSTEGRIEGRLSFHGTRYYQQIMVQYNISPNQYLMNQTQNTLDVPGVLGNISGYDVVQLANEHDPVNQSLQMRRIAEAIGIVNAEKYLFNNTTVEGRVGSDGEYSADELEKADQFEIVTTAQLGGATQEITIHFTVENTKEELETDENSELLAMITNYWTNKGSIVVDDSFDLDRVAPNAMSASDIDVSSLGDDYSIDPATFKYIQPFENAEKGYVTFDIVNSTNSDFRMTHSMEVDFTKTAAEVAASSIQNHEIDLTLETVNVGDSPSIAGVDHSILNQVDPTRIISGEDLLILSNIQYHPSYSVLACQQINDWLDGKTTSFPLSDTGMGGDSSWMHGNHPDDAFMHHLMVFDPTSPNPNQWVNFKNMQPMRMGVQEMIFAQERGQAIDYISQGFDMHQAGDSFDAIAGTKTWAEHATESMHNVGTTGQGWSTWAGKPVFTKEHVSAYDNFLIPYDYSVEGVKVNNTLGMDFIEGMMSGINTFYDNADGSRTGGHRTSVFNALNDTMGWSFTYCGDHVYIMVEVNDHFGMEEGAELPLTGDDAFNREFIAPVPLTAISTAEINRKYPWLVPVFGEKADDALGLVGEEIFFKEVLGLNTMVYKQGDSDAYTGYFWDNLTGPTHNADWLTDFQNAFVGQTIADKNAFLVKYSQFVNSIIIGMGVIPEFKADAVTHLDQKFDEWIASGADVLAQKNAENLETARYQYARHWEDSAVQEVAVAPRISRGYNINGGGTLVGSIIGYDEFPDEIYNH